MNILDGEQVQLSWSIDSLGSLVESVRASARISPDESYELWSVPSFSDGTPEVVAGASIGSGKLELRPNDVLISKINPRINRVWLVSEPKGSLTQIGSTEWLVARIRSGALLLPSFLAFYMSSPLVREAIKSMTQGVTGSHTRAKANQILTIPVPRPSPSEQARIVEILEEQLSRLDVAVKSVQTVREKAAQFRRSLLHAAFTGALTQQDPGHMSDASLPADWELCQLASKCRVVSGSTPKTAVEEYWGGQISWITPNDLSKNRAKYVSAGERFLTAAGYDSCSTQLVPPGSVLFTSRAPIGYVAIASQEVCTNQGFKTAIPSDSLSSEFLYWQLQYLVDDIRSRASGTTFLEISGKGFGATEIVVPCLAEQERIVEILEEQLSRLDATLAVADEVERKANALRRSLLHAAFTGELTRSWREANV